MCVYACVGARVNHQAVFKTDSTKTPVFTPLLTEAETGESVKEQGTECVCYERERRESERGVKESERAVQQLQHILRKVCVRL